MSDTFGSLIDKLTTVDLKMWNTQEMLYEIRKMTFEEFKEKFFKSEEGCLLLWEKFKKSCDLNYQRNILIDEIDEKLIEIVKSAIAGEDTDKYIQRKHKTY